MAADEEAIRKEEELPDTLTITGSTLVDSSTDVSTRMPWGRLIGQKSFLKSVDLVQTFSFGRGEECSFTVTSRDFCSPTFVLRLSKKHFQIEKCRDDNLIYITDFSKNGTFVNKTIVGKNKRKILKNQDKIAVFYPSNSIYVFLSQDTEVSDDFLPPQLIGRFANLCALGKGSCGEVRLVKDRDTFVQYAIKKIILSESNSSLMHQINHPNKVNNEINILRTLSHPCVISMSDIVHVEREVYLVLEYMAGGELTKRILYQPMTEEVAKFYFMQMVLATDYLHSNGIIHRDLKPENILLLDEREETLLKITDFGLSKITDQDDATTMCGTLRYVAPEVINNGFRHYGEYGKEVDIWSLGVILFFMISRDFPFKGEQNSAIARNIVKGNYDISGRFWCDGDRSVLKNLLKKMFELLPKNRITISDIWNHKWIAEERSIKYRIERMVEGLEIPMKDLSLEPPLKKFRACKSSSSSSDESDITLTNVKRTNYSNSPTICC